MISGTAHSRVSSMTPRMVMHGSLPDTPLPMIRSNPILLRDSLHSNNQVIHHNISIPAAFKDLLQA